MTRVLGDENKGAGVKSEDQMRGEIVKTQNTQ